MEKTFSHKFNIGDTVQFKGCINRLLINNVMSETCIGGTQILYRGIPLYPDPNHYRWEDKKVKYVAVLEKALNVNEEMLEVIDEAHSA